jgi:methionyl-tRNA formyltransferase
MDLAFAGTARFGSLVLERLLVSAEFNALHRVVACVTTPDRPRGRHGSPQPSPLKETATAVGLPVLQPGHLDVAFVSDLSARGAGVFVACAYGRIVPAAVLDGIEALVVHPSLLPRWRGAAPVQRALMAGETELGVATLRMTLGVDEGPVGDLRIVHVPREADAGEAFEALAQPAAEGLLAVLDGLARGQVEWREQQGEPTYAAKIDDADRHIDWRRPVREIADQVRALSPHVGAVTELGGRRVLVWRARPAEEPSTKAHGDVPKPGDRLVVAAGEGWLEVLELQEEGRRRMTTQEYLRGAGRRLAGRQPA